MAQMPMASLLRHHSKRLGPDAVALIHDGETVTFAELEARANRRARLFRSLGVGRGDFVTIALPNGNLFYECSFAAWKVGATPNPVSHRLPTQELRAIVDLVQPALIVSEGYEIGSWQVVDPRHGVEDQSSDPTDEPVAAYWKALTSGGSTGVPKVIVDHRPAMWDPEEAMLEQAPSETILNPGPLYHNAPFYFTHTGLFIGNKIVGMPRFDAAETLRLIDTHKVNWINLVPTMMHRIWTLPEQIRNEYDLSSLRLVWHMAAPTPPWLKQAFIDWLGPERLRELYGGTERQGWTAITGIDWLNKKGSVGRTDLGDGQMKIVRQDGSECAPGEVGEIYFLPKEGPGTTYHYIGATAQSIEGGWESIGDMGWVDEDGYLFLTDRRTDLILRGGANIYPAEVEAAIDSCPNVASSVVIGLPDDDLGQCVHAIVELKERASGIAELHAALAERLVAYKLPESYELVDLPLRDDAGKVRRVALRDERLTWLSEGQEFRTRPVATRRK